MSKFLLASEERIKRIETPITSLAVCNAVMLNYSRYDSSDPEYRAPFNFNVPDLHVDEISHFGNCCLLIMFDNGMKLPGDGDIKFMGQIWANLSRFDSQFIFHMEHSSNIVRPVISIIRQQGFYFELGDPIIDSHSILKGLYK